MLTVALKELRDALRDTRSLASSVFYCLMGPGVVWMVSRAVKGDGANAVLAGMISVFALVAAFSGGMNVAMDVMAGERERRSLVPLLSNPVSRLEIILGKWLAVVAFSMAGLLLCLLAFRFVYPPAGGGLWLVLFTGMLPLAWLAAALEIGLATLCSSVKEAHTYLSMLVFAPMAIGMFGVFFPGPAALRSLLPVAGQQAQLQRWLGGQPLTLLSSLLLGLLTTALAAAVLRGTAARLEHDDAVYGR
jgi:sodium transport system permease protein